MRILSMAALTLLAAACATQSASAPEQASEAQAAEAAGAEAPAFDISKAPPPPEVRPLEPVADVERLFALDLPENAPALGSADAKVRVEVFSDFQCPFCASHKDTVHEIEQAYGELVRVEWRNFPLPFHADAANAAQAAVEVHSQAGDAGFWKFHDMLFDNQMDLSIEKLTEYAGKIEGVDASQVVAAIEDGRHVERIQADMNALMMSGAPASTPTTFVNGRLISGAQPMEVFEQAIEKSLAETPEARAAAEQASEGAFPVAHARHVLVQYDGAMRADPAQKRSREDAEALAEELRARAALGEDFDALAREYSDGPSADQGGDLGQFTRGDLVPEFEAVVFGIDPGQVGPVVETPFGFHVIQRLE